MEDILIKKTILNRIEESIHVKENLKEHIEDIKKVAKLAIKILNEGGKIILFGNGGSAADAQHIAGELVGKFLMIRDAIPAIALSTNTSILTAIANDIDFTQVFSRQVEALAKKEDLVIGISTSGKSLNVINGIKKANKIGAKTISLTGSEGGELATICNLSIKVPSRNTPRIQEAHITVGHILCEIIEREFLNEK